MAVVLITGGSRGIGAACAEAFAAKGYDVAVNYVNSKEKAESLCERLSAAYSVRCMAVGADVSDYDAAQKMAESVSAELGTVDILVNNAGVSHSGLFTELAPDQWRRIIDTDLSSVYNCCHAVLPGMIRAHCGCVLNISSMWGEVGASCEVAYSAAKAGVIGLTKALAKELGPSGVRVNCIAPGVIMTDMMAGYDEDTLSALSDETPLMRLGTPADIAKAAVFLCSDDAAFITGQVLGVNGGFVI